MTVRPADRTSVPGCVLQVEYRSGVDGLNDWALAWPPAASSDWLVMIHGHGSEGDQLYTRPDIRDAWLPAFRTGRELGILTPNLRGNAWMSPAAAADMHELLGWVRAEYRVTRFIFASGSMGGTSNLIYACLHPEEVAAVVALGLASDLASFHGWCRATGTRLSGELAQAIEVAYGAPPQQAAGLYLAHSAVANARRLTMPIYMAHGTDDQIIPISQPRELVETMAGMRNVVYTEAPGGGHDAPLGMMVEGLRSVLQRI